MEKAAHKVSLWQVIILFLSVYVLIAMFIDTVFKLSPQTVSLLLIIDNIICVIFILDFFYHLIKAEDKLAFLKWGWIDLVSSIPSLPFLRIGRVTRIFRIFRILRAVRSSKFIIGYLFENRAKSVLLSVGFISFVAVIFSSIAILNFEILPESNIKNIGDAFWWALVTLTTVGYGDKFPVTPEGKVVAAVLMISGIGLFGTFTAYMSSLFLATGEKKLSDSEKMILDELKALRSEVAALRLRGSACLQETSGTGTDEEIDQKSEGE